MDDDDLQARSEQALVVVTLGTATLIACVGPLVICIVRPPRLTAPFRTRSAARDEPPPRPLPGEESTYSSVMTASNTFQTSAAGRLNTTKCDSEKLTMKLAPVASSFPSRTGMKCDAITTVAVFAAKPAT
jgi:hypothetical protein